MHIKKVLFSIFRIVLFCTTQLSFAQEEMKDQLFVIHEELAKADKIGQYEKTSTGWFQMMHDAGLIYLTYAHLNEMIFTITTLFLLLSVPI
jgi:hypothetical protein